MQPEGFLQGDAFLLLESLTLPYCPNFWEDRGFGERKCIGMHLRPDPPGNPDPPG